MFCMDITFCTRNQRIQWSLPVDHSFFFVLNIGPAMMDHYYDIIIASQLYFMKHNHAFCSVNFILCPSDLYWRQ